MKYRLMLLLTALVWGCAFVAQRTGMETIGPFAFNGIRFWLGALSLLPILYMHRKQNAASYASPPKGMTLLTASITLGFFLFAGSAFQQIGLIYTTAGKAGFITALYIVAVPLIGLLMKNTLRLAHILGCLIALSGLYLLAFHDSGEAMNVGDMLNLIGVVFWSLHILCIDRFIPYFSGIKLAVGQFIACGCYNFIAMPLYGETVTVSMVLGAAIPLLYCGILSSGVGYTLQIVAQRHVPPTEASLLCSFEMIFSALAGMVLLGEWMSCRELMGCLLMTIGIFSAQIPSRAILQFKKNLS